MIKSESTKFERIDLDSIFRRYYRPLCLYALHYLHIAEDAEDVVQDCLTEFLERSEKGYLVSDVKSYLYIYPTLLNLLGLENSDGAVLVKAFLTLGSRALLLVRKEK